MEIQNTFQKPEGVEQCPIDGWTTESILFRNDAVRVPGGSKVLSQQKNCQNCPGYRICRPAEQGEDVIIFIN